MRVYVRKNAAHDNESNPPHIVNVSEGEDISQFMKKAGKKLNMTVKKIFMSVGAQLDNVSDLQAS